jgi:hypothetical protein
MMQTVRWRSDGVGRGVLPWASGYVFVFRELGTVGMCVAALDMHAGATVFSKPLF